MKKETVVGYLPDDRPHLGQMLIFALQQFLVMLPATVLASLLMKFNIPTAIFASGVATLVFLLITKGKIPLYYGSSFSYIPAVSIVIASYGSGALDANGLVIPSVMGPIQLAIIISGIVSAIVGVIVKYFGKDKMDKILPASVTGPVATIIGLSLAASAVQQSFAIDPVTNMMGWESLVVSIVTLLTIIILTVVLKKGFISQIPILLGILAGFLVSVIINLIQGEAIIGSSSGQVIGLGVFNWTIFSTLPQMDMSLIPVALLAIVPVALVTIPESTAHIYQLDLYVNELSKKMGKKNYDIKDRLGDNLIGDGVGDIVASAFGGPAGTNYGENISASIVTKNFSSWVFGLTAIIAILISFTPLATFAGFLPSAVVNGASIYLFGVIAAQGITLMIEKHVDMFSSKNLAVIAVIFVIGLGGHYGLPGSGFPLYKVGESIVYFPALAAAAMIGIVLHLGLSLIEKLVDKK